MWWCLWKYNVHQGGWGEGGGLCEGAEGEILPQQGGHSGDPDYQIMLYENTIPTSHDIYLISGWSVKGSFHHRAWCRGPAVEDLIYVMCAEFWIWGKEDIFLHKYYEENRNIFFLDIVMKREYFIIVNVEFSSWVSDQRLQGPSSSLPPWSPSSPSPSSSSFLLSKLWGWQVSAI